MEAVLVPSQYSVRSEHGLMVMVDGPELHRINVWLYEHKMTLIAQVHSHPTEAYHSETDDTIPIITTPGGFSLVVPDFAQGPPDLGSYAVFRLDGVGEWIEMSGDQVSRAINVI